MPEAVREHECRDHRAHVVRLNNLEENMSELKKAVDILERRGINPGVYVGVFSFFGVCFSTLGSIIGVVLSAYFK
jgi:ABC-type lipoprotein release transport system permease subunit